MATISEYYNWTPETTCSIKLKVPTNVDGLISTSTFAGTFTLSLKNINTNAEGTDLIYGENITSDDGKGLIRALFEIAGYNDSTFLQFLATNMTRTETSKITVGDSPTP